MHPFSDFFSSLAGRQHESDPQRLVAADGALRFLLHCFSIALALDGEFGETVRGAEAETVGIFALQFELLLQVVVVYRFPDFKALYYFEVALQAADSLAEGFGRGRLFSLTDGFVFLTFVES